MGLFNFRKWEGRGISMTPEQLRAKLWELNPNFVQNLRDSKYRAISYVDFKTLIAKYRLPNPGVWKVNVRDCDKFCVFFQADMLRGWADASNGDESLAFGYMDGLILDDKGVENGHAWIWHLDNKGVFRFIQAQTNELMTWKVLNVEFAEG